MRSGLSLIVFGLLAGVAAFLATLLKQKNEALDGAQARIAHVEQRMSRMVGASLTADQEAELRTQLAQQSAELERLRALVASLQAQPDVSTSSDTYAGEIAQRSAPVGAVTEQSFDEVKVLQADPDQWRRRFEAESGWQEKSPALAALGQMLGRLPEAKLNFANQAVQTKIMPTVVEQPQDLSAVDGIGAVFEQRLYNAGIGAYWELATLDDETLQRALKVGKTQAATINLEAMRASAGRLAEESGTVGHLWSGESVDDFEPIQGIGKIYEQRLYDAGIRTYAALAKATPEVLQSACPSRSPIPPDYAGWIEAAKRLVGK